MALALLPAASIFPAERSEHGMPKARPEAHLRNGLACHPPGGPRAGLQWSSGAPGARPRPGSGYKSSRIPAGETRFSIVSSLAPWVRGAAVLELVRDICCGKGLLLLPAGGREPALLAARATPATPAVAAWQRAPRGGIKAGALPESGNSARIIGIPKREGGGRGICCFKVSYFRRLLAVAVH